MEVIITLRGKKIAKLVPYKNEAMHNTDRDEIFGLWKKHDDMPSADEYVRTIRKGRQILIIDTDVLIWELRGNVKANKLIHENIPFSISVIR